MQPIPSYFQPRAVNDFFVEITRRQHASGNEDSLRRYIIEVVNRFNSRHPDDLIRIVHYNPEATAPGERNIILYKAGTGKTGPVVILQAHLDMVCVPSSGIFPIGLQSFTDPAGTAYLKGGGHTEQDGTTLGADDGIGVAMALAILTGSQPLTGPVECLFTVQEETSLGGARELDVSLLTGDKFINLDSEDHNIITYGSAGGENVEYTWLPGTVKLPASYSTLRIELSGLRGGHSGVNIHQGPANAVKLLARVLDRLRLTAAFNLYSFSTTNDKHNAIPGQAAAGIALAAASRQAAGDELLRILKAVKQELGAAEPGLHWDFGTDVNADRMLDAATSANLLDLLLQIPHGPLKRNTGPATLVESSANLAVVAADPDGILIRCSHRNSVDSAMENIRQTYIALARLFGIRRIIRLDTGEIAACLQPACRQTNGGSLVFSNSYPAWQPDPDSRLLALASQVYREVYGETGYTREVIHAGLECSWFIRKYREAGRGVDCISIGPTVKTPHSWNERLAVATVEPFYRCVTEIIRRIHNPQGCGA